MEDKDKICYLCVDEMAIKKNLFYKYIADEAVGLEDNGVQKNQFQLALQQYGINSKWKQVVCYTLSGTSISASDVKDLLEKLIEQLTNIGLDVVALVSNMGSNFIQLSKLLGVTTDNSYVEIGNKKLLYYFDPCHLMKAARNNLINNNFHWDTYRASWEDIQNFYEKDKVKLNRMAPKLSAAHLAPTNFQKMNVSLAAQTLSNTVALGIDNHIYFHSLPDEAAGTVQFIRNFDKLFNIFNARNRNPTSKLDYAFSQDESQNEFLTATKEF
ncbi:hypothetical protein NQ315_003493 [Exocentrus adspersus]|uniref:Transposase n=1 Tax=Exocentrus adspersus TaxID=1586481 RepID=A0AAV8V5M6_9CUCU|nr:hypothetical protein NQ315_003493 [Exocentrus adspersus]